MVLWTGAEHGFTDPRWTGLIPFHGNVILAADLKMDGCGHGWRGNGGQQRAKRGGSIGELAGVAGNGRGQREKD